MQCDKLQYHTGDIIWFNGYLTSFSKLSHISKIVYVELFSNDGLIIRQLMLPVKDGNFNGNIILPEKIKSGNYFLRAYSAWMINFSSSLFFYKAITITDENKNVVSNESPPAKNFSIRFFPEGGNLVQGLTSLVAFKSVDHHGEPLPVSGKVVNSFGETVALLSSGKNGLGSFIVHCSPLISYTAVVTENGITQKIPLPDAKKSGIVLHLENHHGEKKDTAFFNISRSKTDKEKYQNLILCVRMNGQSSLSLVRFDDAVAGDPMDTILNAPSPLISNLGGGILHISVINQFGEILAQRMAFLHDAQPLSYELKMDNIKINPDSKENNIVTLRVPEDFEGNSLSVSITDADKTIDPDKNGSVEEGMLLSANIDAYAGTPGRLFDTNPEAWRAFDLFMLTSKTAMPDLQEIIGNEFPSIKYLPEQSIVLKGRMYKIAANNKRELLRDCSTLIIMKSRKDSATRLLNAFTDSSGDFAITGLDFNDTADIYAQTGEKTGNAVRENISVEYDKDIYDSIRQTKFVSSSFLWQKWDDTIVMHLQDSVFMDSVVNQKGGFLQAVTVKAKLKTHIDSLLSEYATGIFANPNVWAKTLDFTNDPITNNLDENVLDYLNGKVAGLNYKIDYASRQYLVYWRVSNMISGLSAADQYKLNSPSFFLNEQLLNVGIEGYDQAIALLYNIRMMDVAMIRVYQPGANPMVPDNGPHGSIVIYLKKTGENHHPDSRLSFSPSIKIGYSTSADNSEGIGNSIKGTEYFSKNNATVFWDPLIKIDKSAHGATFIFHSNSYSKRYRIIAEGVDNKGTIVRLNKVVE
ncbi:MAG TPA: hypothetical protein VMT76_03375 [Puia sp.]|nr:hypothetical protein [Puia sp.]